MTDDVSHRPVTVIGGTGRIGGHVVDRLLTAGWPVRVVTRNPSRAGAVRDRGAEVFEGDIRDAGSLTAPLSGAGGVMVSIEPGTADEGPDSPRATMYDGVLNVLNEASADLRTFVLISQIYVTRHDHPMNAGGHLLDWRLKGEDALRGSGLPYTIIRPGWLVTGRPDGTGVQLEQGDRSEGQVAVEDVGNACVAAFTVAADLPGRTFEIYDRPGPAEIDWRSLIGALAPDHSDGKHDNPSTS